MKVLLYAARGESKCFCTQLEVLQAHPQVLLYEYSKYFCTSKGATRGESKGFCSQLEVLQVHPQVLLYE